IPDDRVPELEAVLVDVIEEGGDTAPGGPGRVAQHGHGMGPRLGVSPGVDGQEALLWDRVVPEKEDRARPRLLDPAVAGRGGARVLLAERAERERRRDRGEQARRFVAGAVVHDDDLEVWRGDLMTERVENPAERVGALESRDDDGEGRSHEKISASVVLTSGGSSGRNARKKSESNRSSPG